MTTRRQLERTIVHQAICESAAFDHAEFLQRELDEQRRQNVELSRERKALLAENASLRSDLDEHVSLIHRLCDERMQQRHRLTITRRLLEDEEQYSDNLRAEVKKLKSRKAKGKR